MTIVHPCRIAAAFCLATALFAQQAPIVRQPPSVPQIPASDDAPPPIQEIATLRATTREVQLDILAVDGKGNSVTGLKKEDFTLSEDGVEQHILSFEEHSPTTVTSGHAGPRLPPNTFSNFTRPENVVASTVILIDALDMGLQDQMYLHEELIAYAKTMGPGNPIAIFVLDTRMHLVQGFTTDPATLMEAIKSKRCRPELVPPISPGAGITGRKLRQEVRAAGMQMLGRYLAAFPGRKNIIWFTGYEPYKIVFDTAAGAAFPDYASLHDEFSAATETDDLRLSQVAIYPIDAGGLRVDPRFSAANRGGPNLGEGGFQRNMAREQGHFEELAGRTGGKAYMNDNGIKQDIAQIVENGSRYYTVVYAPSDNRWYGQLRHIKVQTPINGLHLQYRNGYLARNRLKRDANNLAGAQSSTTTGDFHPAAEGLPPDSQGALLRRAGLESLQASMTMGEIAPTELIFDASVAPSPTVAKKEKNDALPPDNFLRPGFQKKPYREYEVLYSADLSGIRLSPSTDGIRHGVVQFVAVVYSDTGDVVNSLMTTATLDLSEPTYRSMLKSGLTMKQKIAIPVKPNCFLRLGVHDVAGERMGAIEIPVADIVLGVTGVGLKVAP